MNERKKLKKHLGDKYIFKMYLSVNEVKKLLSENSKDKHDTLFASLTVGCVKINAVVFPTPDKMLLGFDILVKDTPESEEWICYDTLSDEIKLSHRSIEQSMFDILNREVKEYGLSYTECNFEVINGKSIKAEIGRFVARCEKSKLRQFGQFFKGRYSSRRKTRGCSRSLVSVYGRRQRRLPCGFSHFSASKIHRG